MTFEEWRSKRKWTMDIDTQYPEIGKINVNGFLYPDGAFTLLNYVDPGSWYTVVGNDELNDEDLDVVEKFLWENHSRHNYNNSFDEEEEQLTTGFKLFCEQSGLKHESMDEVHAVLVTKAHDKEVEWKASTRLLATCDEFMDRWVDMVERRAEAAESKATEPK